MANYGLPITTDALPLHGGLAGTYGVLRLRFHRSIAVCAVTYEDASNWAILSLIVNEWNGDLLPTEQLFGG